MITNKHSWSLRPCLNKSFDPIESPVPPRQRDHSPRLPQTQCVRSSLPPAPSLTLSGTPGQSTFPSHHDSQSERLSWGNQLLAGLGSPLPAITNSNHLKAHFTQSQTKEITLLKLRNPLIARVCTGLHVNRKFFLS